MTNNLTVEDYTQEHKGICTELFIKVYSAEPFNFSWLDSEKADRYLSDLENSTNSKGYVLKENENIVGVCLGQREEHFMNVGYKINEFFIEPDHQHMGLGSYFLEEVENRLRDCDVKIMTLFTQRHMDSFTFYQKHDYIPSEETVHMSKLIRQEAPLETVEV